MKHKNKTIVRFPSRSLYIFCLCLSLLVTKLIRKAGVVLLTKYTNCNRQMLTCRCGCIVDKKSKLWSANVNMPSVAVSIVAKSCYSLTIDWSYSFTKSLFFQFLCQHCNVLSGCYERLTHDHKISTVKKCGSWIWHNWLNMCTHNLNCDRKYVSR